MLPSTTEEQPKNPRVGRAILLPRVRPLLQSGAFSSRAPLFVFRVESVLLSPTRGGRVFFGYHLPNFTFPGAAPAELFDRFLALVTTAEDEGFDLVTVMDHVYQINGIGPETDP